MRFISFLTIQEYNHNPAIDTKVTTIIKMKVGVTRSETPAFSPRDRQNHRVSTLVLKNNERLKRER
jgi:hypothetical protein